VRLLFCREYPGEKRILDKTGILWYGSFLLDKIEMPIMIFDLNLNYS